MGCGASYEESAYGTSGQPLSKTPAIGNGYFEQMKNGQHRIVSKEAQVDKETLERYLELERQIQEMEKNAPLSSLEIKTHSLEQLKLDIEKKEAELVELRAKTEKEKKEVDELDNDDVKSALLEAGANFDEKKAMEMEEYLAAMNRQEMAESELANKKKQAEDLEEEVKTLQVSGDKLQELYSEQDDVLGRIFGGDYGSPMENRLEAELDELEFQRAKILEANFKWRQAQMMMEYACKQMAVAVQKWRNLEDVPQIELEVRYSLASETRNNLIAATQNISGAQRYLENVQFPYCTPAEVDTLNKATAYVFTDMQSPERHGHAMQCYQTTHQRAAALLNWFDQVINTSIMRDLHDVNEKVKMKTLALRRERINLIKNKVEELGGKPLDIDLEAGWGDSDIDIDELQRQINSAQIVKVAGGGNTLSDMDALHPRGASALIADMPSQEQIFGKQIEEFTRQHKEELDRLMKEQEMNQMRMNKSLQEKLNARRQRRAMVKVENMQKEAIETIEE